VSSKSRYRRAERESIAAEVSLHVVGAGDATAA